MPGFDQHIFEVAGDIGVSRVAAEYSTGVLLTHGIQSPELVPHQSTKEYDALVSMGVSPTRLYSGGVKELEYQTAESDSEVDDGSSSEDDEEDDDDSEDEESETSSSEGYVFVNNVPVGTDCIVHPQQDHHHGADVGGLRRQTQSGHSARRMEGPSAPWPSACMVSPQEPKQRVGCSTKRMEKRPIHGFARAVEGFFTNIVSIAKKEWEESCASNNIIASRCRVVGDTSGASTPATPGEEKIGWASCSGMTAGGSPSAIPPPGKLGPSAHMGSMAARQPRNCDQESTCRVVETAREYVPMEDPDTAAELDQMWESADDLANLREAVFLVGAGILGIPVDRVRRTMRVFVRSGCRKVENVHKDLILQGADEEIVRELLANNNARSKDHVTGNTEVLSPYECGICSRIILEKDLYVVDMSCRHKFCSGCIRNHMKSVLRNDPAKLHSLPCPSNSVCSQIVTQDDIIALLGPSDYHTSFSAYEQLKYNEESQRMLRELESKLFECELCFEQYPMAQFLNFYNCTHKCCLTCMTRMVEAKMGNVKELVKISCPFGCGAPISEHEIRRCVTQENYRKIERLLVHAGLSSMQDWTWCPRQGCNGGVVMPEGVSIAECPYCETKWCTICHDDEHFGTCEEFRAWKETNGLADTKTDSWARGNTKRCPQCKEPIEKNGGCDNMECGKCGHTFKWSKAKAYR